MLKNNNITTRAIMEIAQRPFKRILVLVGWFIAIVIYWIIPRQIRGANKLSNDFFGMLELKKVFIVLI
ncbi:hypothetical protein GCM10007962_28000 [Yeosuana aromativorans]|uniref:Uncharacterized protein n=1 Tax=Yeosuana aromativorans TaxID=288019 RepID=A0A8J3BSF6_9FLAO|nr:hypothetical protein GCM10007962_28000 [Yeosuana aromativorans]